MAEMVWAAPASIFPRKEGYLPLPADETLQKWLAKSRFLPRHEAEENPNYRQWIPYVTLRRSGKLFCMRRTTGGGEVRLHERLTIGLGGHVNPIDETCRDGAIIGALWRELQEEASLGHTDGELQRGGLVLLSDNAVSKVHVGVHFWFDLKAGKKVRLNEEGGKDGRWVGQKDLSATDPALETWSTAVLLAQGWGTKA